MLKPEEREFVGVVADKLKRLKDALSKKITEGELRDNICNNLRFLLIDDGYQRAWDLVSGQHKITIPAVDFNQFSAGKDLDKCVFMQASGASVGGTEISGFAYYDYAINDAQAKEMTKNKSDAKTHFPVKRFLSSLCMVIRGVRVNRQQLIQYVGYRAGGIHMTPSPGKDKYEQVFQALDSLRKGKGQWQILGHNPVYLEFLSIAQALVNSRDCGQFLRRAKELGLG